MIILWLLLPYLLTHFGIQKMVAFEWVHSPSILSNLYIFSTGSEFWNTKLIKMGWSGPNWVRNIVGITITIVYTVVYTVAQFSVGIFGVPKMECARAKWGSEHKSCRNTYLDLNYDVSNAQAFTYDNLLSCLQETAIICHMPKLVRYLRL